MRYLSRFQVNFGASSSAPRSYTGKNWEALPVQLKAVEWALHFANVEKVREAGANKGFWVAKFLKFVNLGEGYKWCAAFVSYVLSMAGWTKFKSAAVLGWHGWAQKNNRVSKKPEKGSIALWIRGSGRQQSRHIEIVVGVAGDDCPSNLHPSKVVPRGYLFTVGGNTSSGSRGSQNDGDGVFPRLRRINEFTAFVTWW